MPEPEIPSHLRRLMAEIGPKWKSDTRGHIRLMIEEFSKVLATAPKDGVRVVRDISYGDHDRQALDVYVPDQGQARYPALIFVHGGGFTDGHRNLTSDIYANVLYYFARNGVVGINAGYRLAADAKYPEATKDIASVVRWVHDNAADYAIDPKRIFLMGHSAGGAHVASYAYDKRQHPSSGPGLTGLFVISGRVRADNRPENPNAKRVEAYYGDDARRYDDVSAVTHVDATSVPTFIAAAEFENPLIDVYCLELAHKLAVAKGYAPPFLWLKGHNHTSMVGHFNTAEDILGRACLDFIRQTGAP